MRIAPLILLVLLGNVANAQTENELILEGRTVDEWLGLLQLNDGFIAPANEVLDESAANDVVQLLTGVNEDSPRVITSLHEALQRKPSKALAARLLARLTRRAWLRRDEVTTKQTLTRLGNRAMLETAAPLLKAANHKLRSDVCRLLCAAGPTAQQIVPALVQAFEDKTWSGRFSAAEPLGFIGGAAAQTALIAALGDKDDVVARAAADAIGWIGPKAARAVPALIVALRTRRPDVNLPSGVVDWGPKLQAKAAYALAKIGPAAIAAVPQLEKAARDRQEDLRKAATYALGAIQAPKSD